MAKKKSKKKYKGVDYIARVLVKYQKGKFPTYKSALVRAREIKNELGDNNVTVKNVLSLSRTKRAIALTEELTRVRPYYELIEYRAIILGLVSDKIQFISKLFPEDVEPMFGGYEWSYHTYFAPFVNFCNKLKQQAEIETQTKMQSPLPWNVTCTEPDKNGVSRIISCNEYGDEMDFGFDPNQIVDTTVPVTTKTGKKETKKETGKEKPPTITQTESAEIIEAKTKQIEATEKLKRQENISQLLDLLKSGVITKEEFKDLMSKV